MGTVVDDDFRHLGQRLQGLRRAQGLTLELLAADSGLSAGYLSQIENGQAVPSLTALQVIAAEPRGRGGDVLPGGRRARRRASSALPTGTRSASSRSRARSTRCSPSRSRTRRSRRSTPATYPGAGALPFRHLGEEFALVLSGTLRLQIGEETHELGARRLGPLLLAARPLGRGAVRRAGRGALDPHPGDRMTTAQRPTRAVRGRRRARPAAARAPARARADARRGRGGGGHLGRPLLGDREGEHPAVAPRARAARARARPDARRGAPRLAGPADRARPRRRPSSDAARLAPRRLARSRSCSVGGAGARRRAAVPARRRRRLRLRARRRDRDRGERRSARARRPATRSTATPRARSPGPPSARPAGTLWVRARAARPRSRPSCRRARQPARSASARPADRRTATAPATCGRRSRARARPGARALQPLACLFDARRGGRRRPSAAATSVRRVGHLQWLAARDPVGAVGEHGDEQVRRATARERPQRAGAHQQLAVAEERDHLTLGPRLRDAERGTASADPIEPPR